MHVTFVLLLGLSAGVLVGLMGIGGGIIVVPALVYVAGMDQHMAQGTSLFILLPPLGLGALETYRRRGDVDWPAGIACALGFFAGGYLGGRMALGIPSRQLEALFGAFLMFSAAMLWREPRPERERSVPHA